MTNWKNNVTPLSVADLSPAAHSDVEIAVDRLRAHTPKLSGSTLDFARSLLAGYDKYGKWSPKQLACARRLVDEVNQPPLAIERIQLGEIRRALRFAGAGAFLHVGGFRFNWATSEANLGRIFVKCEGTYIGKIDTDGAFLQSRECLPIHITNLLKINADVPAAVAAHGHESGECGCCGRALSNPESIARGIGPICAERFGF